MKITGEDSTTHEREVHLARPARFAALRPLTAVLALSGLLFASSAQAGAAPSTGGYVALGDSFASGPFIPDQRPDPLGCGRSDHNYPTLVAEALHVGTFDDVSCGGAATAAMTTAQPVLLGSNPPQFGALRPDTRLVTVTIGGNDIQFTQIALTCTTLGLTDPFGAPCMRHFTTATGEDELAQRVDATAGKIADVLDGIRRRSPRATVVLVGYLRILPANGGCWPTVPIAAGDVPYLNGVEVRLNAVLRAAAAAHDATFVDPYSAGTGHDVCAPLGRKWVEGVVPTAPAFPLHPNAAGMSVVAGLVLDALGAGDAART